MEARVLLKQGTVCNPVRSAYAMIQEEKSESNEYKLRIPVKDVKIENSS